ncbi:MAG: DNA repair protein RadA [Defluviitaleaceae bacterium]|nr:DNA repair protein RadA [Defluviitaleaceae bacterium]
MAKQTTAFACANCGYESAKWLGKCPSCGSYNSLEEKEYPAAAASGRPAHKSIGTGAPLRLSEIKAHGDERIPTGISELDNVLSGGVVKGSLILVGGDPGIGKSTLLLQLSRNVCRAGRTTLYISGEESAAQIRMRAARLGVDTDNLLILAENDMEAIEAALADTQPDMAVIDSIQTVYNPAISSTPGSVTQIRECTSALMKIAKGRNVTVWIVGHVTKEGALAGPRVLEHMVDTVLYFEGEKRESYRIIRAVKNRFGATDEIAIFEMREDGLREITNPSEYMLSGRPIRVPGSVVSCGMEGTRPILAEVQALCCFTSFGIPRRVVNGLDYNRTVMLIAVLEKRAGLKLGTYDVYVNIAGGLKIDEPYVDAAAVLSIASSYRNTPIDPYTAVLGEVGLTGELRAVANAEKRAAEAAKQGFKTCLMPRVNLKGLREYGEMKIVGVRNVVELLNEGLGKE